LARIATAIRAKFSVEISSPSAVSVLAIYCTIRVEKLGIHPRKFYALVRLGIIEKLSWGTYRLASRRELSNPDIVTVAVRVPNGVICLISALSYHGITTQLPREVCIALPQGASVPRIEYPPIHVFRFSKEALSSGVETHQIDGVAVKVSSAEKTIADCFKFRNKIGIGTALEALRMYLRRKSKDMDKLQKYARICRVENVLRPYLQALQQQTKGI